MTAVEFLDSAGSALALVQDPAYRGVGTHVYKYTNGTWGDFASQLGGVSPGSSQTTEKHPGVVGVHRLASGTFLLHGSGDHHWVMRGRELSSFRHPAPSAGWRASIRPHPTDPERLLMKAPRGTTCDGYGGMQKCRYDLLLSENMGTTWENLRENSKGRVVSFSDFDWVDSAYVDSTFSGNAPPLASSAVIATVYETEDDASRKGAGALHFVRSDTAFREKHERLLTCGDQFELLKDRMILAAPGGCDLKGPGVHVDENKHDREQNRLYFSKDIGHTYEEVCFPNDDGANAFHIFPTDEGSFLLAKEDPPSAISKVTVTSTLMAPGVPGTMLVPVLEDVFFEYGINDIEKIEGLPGVWFANQLDVTGWLESASPPDPSTAKNFVRSRVSFNGGATWQPIPQPTNYESGKQKQSGPVGTVKCNTCTGPNCFLQLSGPSQWSYSQGSEMQPTVYHHANAPALLIANGNFGEYVDLESGGCTFVSRNGGYSWEEIAGGTNVYEFTDHGALLVMATHASEGPTSTIHFSADEGRCWRTLDIAGGAIKVHNIRSEPRGENHELVLVGYTCVPLPPGGDPSYSECTGEAGQPERGVLITLDFKKLLKGLRDCGPNDYYQFDLGAAMGGQCTLGQSLHFERQKRVSICLNGRDYERPDYHVESCACTYNDVQCEFGLSRTSLEECEFTGESTGTCYKEEEGGKKKYVPSESGFRSIAGDACVGLDLIIHDTDGEGHLLHRKGGGVLRFFAYLLLCAALGTGVYLAWRRLCTEDQRERIRDAMGRCYEAGLGLLSRARGQQNYYAYREAFQPLTDTDMDADAVEL